MIVDRSCFGAVNRYCRWQSRVGVGRTGSVILNDGIWRAQGDSRERERSDCDPIVLNTIVV